MHIRKAANLSIMEKPKLAVNATIHKKQNTLTDSSIFKYLTSPRSSKNKYKIPSSRLEVLNLTKDQACKQRKSKNRLLYGSAVISDGVNIKKKILKKDSKSKCVDVTSSFQESSNTHLKIQPLIQVKPKTKCKKSTNFGAMTKSKLTGMPYQKNRAENKTELKFKDNLTSKMILNLSKGNKNESIDMKNDKIFIQDSISDSESKQIIQNKLHFQKIQQGLDIQASSQKNKSILEYKTEDHRGFK